MKTKQNIHLLLSILTVLTLFTKTQASQELQYNFLDSQSMSMEESDQTFCNNICKDNCFNCCQKMCECVDDYACTRFCTICCANSYDTIMEPGCEGHEPPYTCTESCSIFCENISAFIICCPCMTYLLISETCKDYKDNEKERNTVPENCANKKRAVSPEGE